MTEFDEQRKGLELRRHKLMERLAQCADEIGKIDIDIAIVDSQRLMEDLGRPQD